MSLSFILIKTCRFGNEYCIRYALCRQRGRGWTTCQLSAERSMPSSNCYCSQYACSYSATHCRTSGEVAAFYHRIPSTASCSRQSYIRQC